MSGSVDTFPEIDSSASRHDEPSGKFLDIDALTCAFADAVLSGKLQANERFFCRPAPHHHRARYTDRHGQVQWTDCSAADCFEVTHEVRARVEELRRSG